MNIKELLECGTAISVQVTPADLREFGLFIVNEVKTMMAAEKEPDVRLTTEEAAKQLGKSTNCLWRWAKEGILKPSGYCGRNPYYWQSDINNFLNQK